MAVNVNRGVADQFYRYKMPKLIAKVEGKGNGIKTVIVNMPEVAKALSRPPAYPTKFFGCELGAQTTMDLKNDRFIVNGAHDAARLQDMLDTFIKKFVLCPQCDNPETELQVSQKKQLIHQRCVACGYQGPVDMRHKLTTYILKNPPNVSGSTDSNTPNKKDKKGSRKKNAEENGKEAEEGSPTNSPPETPVDERDNNWIDDWGDDISRDAVEKRMESLSSGAKGLTLNDELEKTMTQRLEILFEFVKEKKAAGLPDGADKEILAEAERLEVKDKATLVLAELFFNADMLKQIITFRKYFLRFTHQNKKAQKYLLGGFELLVNKYKDVLLAKTAHILKAFYDADIVEEDVILEWAKKPVKKYVSKEMAQQIHTKATPFVNWLKEADEESSEESEEEDVGIVYDSKAKDKLSVEVVKPAKLPESNDSAEDDLDIDDI